MPFFSQKDKGLDLDEIEPVHCKAWTTKKGVHKEARTLFRRKDNKTWVKVHNITTGSAHIRLAYKNERRAWKNRIFEVKFDFTAETPLTEEKASDIAKEIMRKDDSTEWFDFYNEESVLGFEQSEHKVKEDDLDACSDVEQSDEGIALDNAKAYDLKGWAG